MVESIKEYKQMNGVCILKIFLKPTAKFPNGGYFYAPAEAIDLVQRYSWFLNQAGNGVRVVAGIWSGYSCKTIFFHKELFKFYHGYDWQKEVDHVNHIEFDNTDNNLNAVTTQQNGFNKFTRGYYYCNRDKYFQPQIHINSKPYCPFSIVRREDEACILQNRLEQVDLRSILGTNYYMFDFKKYRRGSEDILDLERTGQISEEEAIYRHILGYSQNAWFYLRYGLEQYFKDYNIPVPKYSLNENGFMVHPITGQRLCPF